MSCPETNNRGVLHFYCNNSSSSDITNVFRRILNPFCRKYKYFWSKKCLHGQLTLADNRLKTLIWAIFGSWGVTLAQLVKASVGHSDVRRFEPHLGHNLLSCGVFLVKSRYFGLPLAQSIRPNWQSLSAGGSVAIQTWSIYKVYT